ncbi:membrane hypothetical protein [Planktothrix sp. PCC 11201]|uniref:hypothetical protein n=1 Tax=Planktothrix sp. PCC 11201 TaxID=1729650 RepID=UPI00091DBCA6|nr:hypothetical protein [Planktothrix sp. PCC 11201]SKB13242.1 membrane hypothetical protein [Planktothrix sp. PCC 11201]
MDKLSKTLDHLELIRISLSIGTQQLRHQVQTLLYSRDAKVNSSKSFLATSLLPYFHRVQPRKRLSRRRYQRLRSWLFFLILFGIWGWWNSKLLFSTAFGALVMSWVYRHRELPVNLNQWDWYRRLERSQRQFLFAFGSGVSSCIFLYISLSIWTSSQSPEMALSLIGQNLGILGILIFIIWQWYQQKFNIGKSQLNRWLGDLTQENCLKRLIAVRQLTTAFKNFPQHSGNPQLLLEAKRWQPLPPIEFFQEIDQTHIVEYFQLMLYQENEPIVREALLEGLQILQQDYKNYS